MPAPVDIHMHPAQPLLLFNRQVLDQALALVSHFGSADQVALPPLAGPVGAHVRHIIEHCDALVDAAYVGVVDYDARVRERALEASPQLATARLLALRQRLATWPASTLDRPLRVRGRSGLAGECAFEVGSTIGRELAFVASHAIHHFAVLVAQGQTQQLPLPADFGKAPATVAHERARAAAAAAPASPVREAA